MADYENHSPVVDTDAAIIVNVGTKDFSFGANFNHIIGVAGDHNSNVVSFLIDRFIDSHDILECKEHIVRWKSKSTGNGDEFLITDIKESEENKDKVLLGWLISEDVTANIGDFEFALRISDYDSDGQLIYRWKTKKGNGLLVETGFDDEYPETIRKSYLALIDQATGDKYNLYVSGGKLMMRESED